ncbi:MAG: AAA family ATPase [Methanolobus sp.]|nr:AAA family ATPase [Methanolobus sp.]
MKIKSMSIQNYKCHKELLDISLYTISTFIGENDSGKTSIIDFLELMLTNKSPNENDFFHDSEGIFQDEIIGEITLLPNPELLETISSLLNESNELKIKKVITKRESKLFIEKKKYADERFNQFENMRAAELTKLLEDYKLEPQSNQEFRKEIVRKFLEENRVQSEYEFVLDDWRNIAPFLPKLIRYDVNDYRNPQSMIFKTLNEKFSDLIYTYSEEDGSKNFIIAELEKLAEIAEEEINNEANKLKSYIIKYNPDIEDIYIFPEFDFSKALTSISLELIDKKTKSRIVFENRGFGTQKRLFMGIFDWESAVLKNLSGTPVIRCYDEPDNSLHIDAQRKMYKAIREIAESESNQIILCTHSLFLIDSMPTNTINLLKRKEDSTTFFESLKGETELEISQFMTSVCREMGLSNSHFFFEKAFILVEGQTEINFLPLAYKKTNNSSFVEDGISIINLGGNGAAADFMKLLMKNKKDLVILFLDSDTRNVKKSDLYRAFDQMQDCNEEEYKKWVDDFFDEKLMLIGEKELEDTFSDDFIAEVLNKHRKKNNSSEWEPDEIKELRKFKKFSDAILAAVAQNCSPNYLNKPQLGRFFAEECTEEIIPDKVKELFKKARTIAGI